MASRSGFSRSISLPRTWKLRKRCSGARRRNARIEPHRYMYVVVVLDEKLFSGTRSPSKFCLSLVEEFTTMTAMRKLLQLALAVAVFAPVTANATVYDIHLGGMFSTPCSSGDGVVNPRF